jgi:hypothetical protein
MRKLWRNGRTLMEYASGETNKITEYFSQDSLCPVRDSNKASPEYMFTALLLHQSARLHGVTPQKLILFIDATC